jgi:hypothetical protein
VATGNGRVEPKRMVSGSVPAQTPERVAMGTSAQGVRMPPVAMPWPSSASAGVPSSPTMSSRGAVGGRVPSWTHLCSQATAALAT